MGFKTRRYTFVAPIESRYMGTNSRGRLYYTVVNVPLGVPSGRARVRGHVESAPIELAINRSGEDRYLLLSKALLRAIGRVVGDNVRVAFELIDPDTVRVAPELEAALAASLPARLVWAELTAGKKRTFATYVERAKTPATRDRYCREVIGRLIDGRLDMRQP